MTSVLIGEAEGFRSVMQDLSANMVREINDALRGTGHLTERVQRDTMMEIYPDIWMPHAATAVDLSQAWYQASAPEIAVNVVTLLMPTPQTIAGQVAWAFTQHAMHHALLAAAQRDLWNEARRTIAANADKEEGATWARHASANACRFCQTLATRGPVYASKKSAEQDHDSRKFLGLSRETYHKHCHCVAVPVRPGKSYEPPAYVEKWTEDYEKAAKMSPTRDMKSVMAAYRQMDSEK
ncbi:hypothetical protein [Nocardia grenadensis]|uniref:VG15 protein n=1 Tax=Nocardia grenadensis TaxID=931537 RepID=UPI003D730317